MEMDAVSKSAPQKMGYMLHDRKGNTWFAADVGLIGL
jgi:hypothetical protein